MPKLKKSVELRCAESPEKEAAYKILVDPDAQEEEWVEASRVLETLSAEPSDAPAAGSTFLTKQLNDKPQARSFMRDSLTLLCIMVIAFAGLHYGALKAGRWKLDLGENQSAAQFLDAAIFTNPFNADAYTWRARAWLQSGQDGSLDKALRTVNQALLLMPDSGVALWTRATIYLQQGLTDKALDDSLRVTQLLPYNYKNFELLGDLNVYQNQLPDAIAAYDKALALGSGSAQLIFKRGSIKDRNGDYPDAIKDFDQALAQDPHLAAALVERGNAHRMLQDVERARADYLAAVELLGQENNTLSAAEVSGKAAECDYVLGNYEEAIKEASVAIALVGNENDYRMRANAECKLNRPTQALADLSHCIGLTDAEYELITAEAHARLGQRSEMEHRLSAATAAGAEPDDLTYVRSFLRLTAKASPDGHPDMRTYMEQLQRRIKSNWTPGQHPDSLATATTFKISTSGELSDATIKRSSSNRMVDGAALRALRASAPFAALPPGINQTIDVDFNFNYNVLEGKAAGSADGTNSSRVSPTF